MSEESSTAIKGFESTNGEIWNSEPTMTNGSVKKISDSNSSFPEVEMQFSGEKSMFQSAIGAVVSCLGSAVGTGNIWRFPRIVATQSYSQGSLTFYLVWISILFIWSIPIIVIEYAVGRFCQVSAPLAFAKFFGPKFFWVGGWMVAVIFFLGCYYPVILGWCLYYLFVSCTASQLPTTEQEGKELFNNYAMNSSWPVLTQVVAVTLTGICLAGGIKWIEKANIVLVPLLLSIVVFTFGWSLTREYAEVGISFILTPSWNSLAEPSLWIAAAGQNAFDTGAGMSILATYATFMSKSSAIVTYSYLIPIINNIISFFASVTIFSTVFSTIIQTTPTATRAAILKIMQDSGPGSTGLTFTWFHPSLDPSDAGWLDKFKTKDFLTPIYGYTVSLLGEMCKGYDQTMSMMITMINRTDTHGTIAPQCIYALMQCGMGKFVIQYVEVCARIPVLFSKVGIFGRVLCALFFLCLVFAGISSLLSLIQVIVLTLKEFKVPHRIAVSVSLLATFLFGLPSAIKLEFLTNQDNTWGYGLIISGFLFSVLAIHYGPLKFRRILVNEYGEGDWKLTIVWVPIIMFAVPIQTFVLIVWWIYDYIDTQPYWYTLSLDSLITTLLEWAVVLFILLTINFILYRTNILTETLENIGGCDPYNPCTYEDHELKPLNVEQFGAGVFMISDSDKVTPF